MKETRIDGYFKNSRDYFISLKIILSEAILSKVSFEQIRTAVMNLIYHELKEI